jgi:cobalt/nickel transport system permease protein
MGAGHAHPLYVHEHSRLHRLAPETKIVAALGAVLCVALTPREAVWAFAVYTLVVSTLIAISRITFRFVLKRLLVVLPFILFAVFIPFVGTGETTEILGVHMSISGLWAAWNIMAKAVLGASLSILLTATTEIPEIIRGMGVLRVPVLFTSIAAFMIRYLELISEEFGRMRVAMTARGYDPRWLTQARPIATSAGALFVRSYERGERVHSAMLARGFTGEMPAIRRVTVDSGQWFLVLAVVAVFAVVSVSAMVLT